MLFRAEEWKLEVGVRPLRTDVLYGFRRSRELDSNRKADISVNGTWEQAADRSRGHTGCNYTFMHVIAFRSPWRTPTGLAGVRNPFWPLDEK